MSLFLLLSGFLILCSFVFLSFYFSCAACSLLHTDFSLIAVSGTYSLLWWMDLVIVVASLFCRAWALGHWVSVVAACRLSGCDLQALEHRLSSCGAWACSVACGIFPDQGLNPCPLHWHMISYPLYHQGSLHPLFFILLLMDSFCLILASIFCAYQFILLKSFMSLT